MIQDKKNWSRRSFLALTASVVGLGGWLVARDSKDSFAGLAKFVKPNEKWDGSQFLDFLMAVPSLAMLELKKSLELLKQDATIEDLKGFKQDALDVQKEAFRVSNNFLAYKMGDENSLNYHAMTAWVGQASKFALLASPQASTFKLEKFIQNGVVVSLWDRMNIEQRRAVLERADPNGNIKDKAATAALSGVAVLGILNLAVALGGFSFYTWMSITIASAASLAGATLPFAAYLGASSTIGMLTGPIGWAAMALGGAGALAVFARANTKKTIRLVCEIHALKVRSLLAAGMPEEEIQQL